MHFCAQCGAKLYPAAVFCIVCGARTGDGNAVPDNRVGTTDAIPTIAARASTISIGIRYYFAALFVLIVIGFDLFSLYLMSPFKDQASVYGEMGQVIEGALNQAGFWLWVAIICFAIVTIGVLRSWPPYVFWWCASLGTACQKLAAIFVNPTISQPSQSFPIPMASSAMVWLIICVVLAWPRIKVDFRTPVDGSDEADTVASNSVRVWVGVAALALCFLQTMMAVISYFGWKDPTGQSIAVASTSYAVGQVYGHLQAIGSLHIAGSVIALLGLGAFTLLAVRQTHYRLRWTLLAIAALGQFVSLANKLPMLNAEPAPNDGSFPLGALVFVLILALPLLTTKRMKLVGAGA